MFIITDYRTVQLPNDLVEDIIKEIRENKKLGYRSHSEFIIDATRRRLEEVRKAKK
ncbi:MAG: hypothetical protein ACFFA0_05915 [Promethearchaeota archaeon]